MYNQYIKRKTKRGNTMANYDISKMEDLTVTLTLDDDTELECAVITIFEADGHDYIALLPLEGEDFEDGSVYCYTHYTNKYSDGRLIIEYRDPLEFIDALVKEVEHRVILAHCGNCPCCEYLPGFNKYACSLRQQEISFAKLFKHKIDWYCE